MSGYDPSPPSSAQPLRLFELAQRLFVIALVSLSLLVTAAYLYSSGGQNLAEYRHYMADGAYRAQAFLEQRETLLRTLASAIAAPDHGTPMEPLRRVPLPMAGRGQARELSLGEHSLHELRRSTGRLFYTTMTPVRSYVLQHADSGALHWQALPAGHVGAVLKAHGDLPHSVLWLHQPGEAEPLLAYLPIGHEQPTQAWLGLELRGLRDVLQLPPTLAASTYAVFDHDGAPLLRSPGAAARLEGAAPGCDGLSLRGLQCTARLGDSGLRLVYTLPPRQLFDALRGPLLRALLVESLLLAGVALAARAIRRQLLVPLREQRQALLDSLALNRQLFMQAPFGLALVEPGTRAVVQCNAPAADWMRHDRCWAERLVGRGIERTSSSEVCLDDGRQLRVVATLIRYRRQMLSLCMVTEAAPMMSRQAQARLRPGLRLLLLEQNPQIRRALCERLEELGGEVLPVASGRQVLEVEEPARFDAVLVDLDMPDMVPQALLEALRANGYRGPVLGMSDTTSGTAQAVWRRAGVDCLLPRSPGRELLREWLVRMTVREDATDASR